MPIFGYLEYLLFQKHFHRKGQDRFLEFVCSLLIFQVEKVLSQSLNFLVLYYILERPVNIGIPDSLKDWDQAQPSPMNVWSIKDPKLRGVVFA